MSYTPVELRHVRVGRSLFGYNRATVEQLIEEVAESFETTWRERGELGDKVDALEKQLTELRKREELLAHTLVAAEQAASDVRERAKHEAESIVTEAHSEGRAITRAAQADRERLLADARRIEAMLRSALSIFDDSAEAAAPGLALAPAAEKTAAPDWPREDTREFEPISLPPVLEADGPEEEPSPPPVLRRLAGGDTRDFDWGE